METIQEVNRKNGIYQQHIKLRNAQAERQIWYLQNVELRSNKL